MNSVDKLFKLADRFARKISLGQQSSQPGEIASALQKAGVWDKSTEVAPMINTAGIPDSASIAITFTVDNQLNCKYNVAATVPIPPPADEKATPEEKAQAQKDIAQAMAAQKVATAGAAKLSNLLKVKYGAAMKAAMAQGGISVTGTMDIKWLTF